MKDYIHENKPISCDSAIEVEIIRLVRVRAYRRVRFGKVERVRGHYRCL